MLAQLLALNSEYTYVSHGNFSITARKDSNTCLQSLNSFVNNKSQKQATTDWPLNVPSLMHWDGDKTPQVFLFHVFANIFTFTVHTPFFWNIVGDLMVNRLNYDYDYDHREKKEEIKNTY